MNWFLLAISAPFLWSISNYLDKYVLSRAKENALGGSGGFFILTSFSSLIFTLLIGLSIGFGNIFVDKHDSLILIGSGIIQGLYLIFYFFALEKESATTVIALFQTVPIFGFILGYLVLKESPSILQIGAMLLIIFGTFLILKKKEEKLSLHNGTLPLMLASSIFVALYNVMFKFVGESRPFWPSIFWQYLGIAILGIIFFVFSKTYKKQFFDMLINRGAKFLSINFISEISNIVAVLAMNAAVLLAPVAIVLSINSVQPMFVLIEAAILYKFLPKIFGESEKTEINIRYIAGIILVCVGGFLAYI